MKPGPIFIDAGIFVAAVSPRDRYHDDAIDVLDTVRDWPTVVTSDQVLAETWNFVRARMKSVAPARAVRRLAFGVDDVPPLITTVVRIHSGRFAAALERYEQHFDAGLSFTDWTSLVAMEDEGIATIATFDAGFDAWTNVIPHVRT